MNRSRRHGQNTGCCEGTTQRYIWPGYRAGSDIRKPPGPPPPPEPPQPGSPDFQKRALEILTTGEPVAFMLAAFAQEHVGDEILARCMILSMASQAVKNSGRAACLRDRGLRQGEDPRLQENDAPGAGGVQGKGHGEQQGALLHEGSPAPHRPDERRY